MQFSHFYSSFVIKASEALFYVCEYLMQFTKNPHKCKMAQLWAIINSTGRNHGISFVPLHYKITNVREWSVESLLFK